ncbi:OmpA family protein [Thermithiobacillus plumbiphilus]|uniref:OmpA family protein n=1 Tax=Thermithiobacillus plumbiphilus TaxID=1729899 RepID=A0ABU9D8S2_9PROT
MRQSTILVAAIAAAFSTSAMAQEPASDRATIGGAYINLYGGNTFYDDSAHFGLGSKNNAGTAGLRIGTRTSPHFGVELDLNYAHVPYKDDLAPTGLPYSAYSGGDRFKGQFSGALVGVLYALDRDSTPYMTIGVGASSYRYAQSAVTGNDDRTENLMTLWGLGYKHRLGKSLDLRLDAQDEMLWNTPADPGGVLNNLRLTAGVGFAFGGSKPMPAPVAAAAPEPTPAPELPPAVQPAQVESMPIVVTETERTLLENKPVTIDAAKFDFDKAELRPSAYPTLDEIVEFSQKYPDAQFFVDGHTDSIGSESYNRQLSKKRAQAVKDYLTDKGVPSERLKVRALGESRPIASNKTADGRAKNRRVEVRTTIQVQRTSTERSVRPMQQQGPAGQSGGTGGMDSSSPMMQPAQ